MHLTEVDILFNFERQTGSYTRPGAGWTATMGHEERRVQAEKKKRRTLYYLIQQIFKPRLEFCINYHNCGPFWFILCCEIDRLVR